MSSVVRVVHQGEGWTPIPNSTLRDPRLTLEALGLLARLVSRPTNWQIRVPALIREAGVGRDKLRNLLNMLENNGYLIRERRRDASGRWEWESVVSSMPLKSAAGATVDGGSGDKLSTDSQTPNKKTKKEKEETTTSKQGGGRLDLDFPPEIKALPGAQKTVQHADLSSELAQTVVDEVAGQIRGGVAKFPSRLLISLINKAKAGEIERTSWGRKIVEEREVGRRAKAGDADLDRRRLASKTLVPADVPPPPDSSAFLSCALAKAHPDITAAVQRMRKGARA